MTFEEWYEANVERLSVFNHDAALREAWKAGVASEKEKFLKGFLNTEKYRREHR